MIINMKTFWLFRSNLCQYEYYHSIDNLEQFKKECHDFYLLMGIWMLENTELEEFVVWRLRPKGDTGEDRIFKVNNKKFVQKFTEFEYCFNYPKPDITLFRGGFPEYGKLTKANPDFFGLKLYLGVGRRIQPLYGGIYDKVLVEDARDRNPTTGFIPFHKTANPNIFYPIHLEKKWDICWPCNFAQIKYKGQEWFIKQVAKSNYLKSLKILHLGNKPEVGEILCREYSIKNIEFKGWVSRPELNKYFNQSKVGLVTSNELDGSPRVITEIICSGIPITFRVETNITIGTTYDKNRHTCNAMIFNQHYRIDPHTNNKKKYPTKKAFSIDTICQKNWELWNEKRTEQGFKI